MRKRFPFGLLVLFVARFLGADELSVDRESMQIDQSLEIRLILTGTHAAIDDVSLPLHNLIIDAGPSVSSQFNWVNGKSSRRKVFIWVAHPATEGQARVGPLVLFDRNGERLDLRAIAVEVLPEAAAGPTNPSRGIAEMQAAANEDIFILAEANRDQLHLGDQLVLSWFLYSEGDVIRGFRLGPNPPLEDFWVEEIPISDPEPQEVIVSGRIFQRIPVRRTALYPTRVGTLQIGRLEAMVQAMREPQNLFERFSFFERDVVDLRRRSGHVDIDVLPIPADAQATGASTLSCSTPRASGAGLVSFDVALEGTGNLRAVAAPRWERAPSAAIEIQDRGVSVRRSVSAVVMRREWRFLLFPREKGALDIPALRFATFNPQSKRVEELLCEATTISIEPSLGRPSSSGTRGTASSSVDDQPLSRYAATAAIAAGLAAISWLAFRWRRGKPERIDAFRSAAEEPLELRRLLHETLHRHRLSADALYFEPTERGETFRAFNSIIDLMEKQPWTVVESRAEVERRAAEFVRSL